MTQTKFSHACTIAFTVLHDGEDIEDIPVDVLRAALIKRIHDLDSTGDLEWYEAVEIYDTAEEQ